MISPITFYLKSIALITLLAIGNFTYAQKDEAFCESVNDLLNEMYSDGFKNIKGDTYAGRADDEFLSTKKLLGATEARIRDSDTPVLQNIYLEDEESRDLAFEKYEELLIKLKACKPEKWDVKEMTKMQDNDQKSYRFYQTVGSLTNEIVITAWRQFNGYTLTVRFSQR